MASPIRDEIIWRIIQKVATEDTTCLRQDQFERECIFCTGCIVQRQMVVEFDHAPDCIVLLARQLLEQRGEN